MRSDALKRAQAKYESESVVQVKLKLSKTTDADIIERLAQEDNKQGYLKRLIRENMTNGGK